MQQLTKRDGRLVDFDRNKITDAIMKAMAACDMPSESIALSITADVVKQCELLPELTVENVQDIVENALLDRSLKKVAKAYIKYRYLHEMLRNGNTELVNGAMDKLAAKKVENQNANVDENSFGGRIGEAMSFIMKKLALDFKMSPTTKYNHENNIVYQHDLDQWCVGSHNCLTIPFDKLLKNGFITRQTDVRGAQSINTAFQLLAVIIQLQSLQQFGGCSASHVDWSMVPYVRKSFRRHYLKRAFEDYIELGGGSDSGLLIVDDEMKNFLKAHPRETWWELPHRDFRRARKMFDAWYCKGYGLTEADFRFTNAALDVERRIKAIHDTRAEARQAIEGMYHNLNTLQSRSGNQLPFSSINYGTCTEPEGRMIIELLLEGSIEGTGTKGSTPIFPCGIFVLKNGVNKHPGEPNYDLFRLALLSTAKRLYPNYANGDWSAQKAWVDADRKGKQLIVDNLTEEDRLKLKSVLENNTELAKQLTLKPDLTVDYEELPTEQMSTMGCRTANGFDMNGLDSFEKALKEIIATGDTTIDLLSAVQKDGRGNICPATIILPEVAMLADRNPDKFFTLLKQYIEDAKDSLLERYEWISSQPSAVAKFMYRNHTMAGYNPAEGIKSALKHGTLAIGQLGLAEALQLLYGKDHTTPEGLEAAIRIEKLFKERIDFFRKEYKVNFGVYYTPAENLCHTALKKFRNKYGVIENVSDKEFFTNSMHVPVWAKMNPFDKIDIESQLTGYSSAGCITYVELDVSVKYNIDALEKLVVYAMDKDIPYFAINVPNDACMQCGYLGDIPGACPKCGSTDVMRLRRVTGYLSSDYHNFNVGKIDETERRRKHIG